MDSGTSHRADGWRQTPPAFPVTFHGYAGFWKRAAAAIIDGMIAVVIGLGIVFALGVVFGTAAQTAKEGRFIGKMVGVVIGWLYFAGFESSSKQATPGKMAVGIKVTDADGNRISFGRASGRHLGKGLSISLFFIGYLMAAFTQKKQGLHDMLAGCLVVNKGESKRSRTVLVIAIVVAGLIPVAGIFAAALFPAIANGVLQANMTAMSSRMWDIYIPIMSANAERAPLGLGSVWPKAGKKLEEGDDIGQMRFENSSDYFTVLFDGERMGTPDWSPYLYSECADYSKCAGTGVPAKQGAGRLMAENNAWTVIANVADDLPDGIPLIISRNVDPASLIPGDGDLREQYVRLSGEFKTPFGNRGFVMVCKGSVIFRGKFGRHDASLATLYQGADVQKIRAALEKIEYLTP